MLIESYDDIDEEEEDIVGTTEESEALQRKLRSAIEDNDVEKIYEAIGDGAEPNFVHGEAYGCAEGFTPLMAACYRGNLAAVKALLRAGADPNYCNNAHDLILFWAIDGGAEITRTVCEYGADVDQVTAKGWTPLSYAIACGRFSRSYDADTTPADVMKECGATVVGLGPPPFVHEDVQADEKDAHASVEVENLEEEEASVLPDAATTIEAREEETAKGELQRAVEEEEYDMSEIVSDLKRNPFIHEKGRAHRQTS